MKDSLVADASLCAPILKGLGVMQRWLERDGMERLMVAASTLAEFKRQQLPDHVRVNVKKRRGRCINDARGRMYRNTKLIVGR